MAKLAMLLLWTAAVFGGIVTLYCWRTNRHFAETAGYGMLGMMSISNGLEDDSFEELDRDREEAQWRANVWCFAFCLCLALLAGLVGRGMLWGTWLA